MPRAFGSFCLALLVAVPSVLLAQATTGTLEGFVLDQQGAVAPGAVVTVKHVQTNATRSTTTGADGRFRFPNLPVGSYEVAVELAGFARHLRSGVTLSVGQTAVVDVTMTTAGVEETVNVVADAPLINTTNPEVGVRFDSKRVSELPLSADRNILNLALSAPGVSQLASGNSAFATGGVNFSVNGMRLRSNNFMIDGQDSNDPSITGLQQPMNNPDIVQEVRLITNQYGAEFGRAAGSVMNVITKSGSNRLHGSAFFFTNRCATEDSPTDGICLNSMTNLDKAAGRERAPFRREDQWGATLGGPVVKDKTFFFGSYQRWTDTQLGAGFTLRGAPTEDGRRVLQQVAGSRPQVQALLDHLPAAQSPIGTSATITVGGQTYQVPLGSITGSALAEFESEQVMGRLDHHFSPNHILSARYLLNDQLSTGGGQVTPPGLTTRNSAKQQAGNLWLTSILSNNLVNEARVAWQGLATDTRSDDPRSEEIPSIEISELGMVGFNAAASRTAIGLAVNLPQFRNNDTYQIQNTLSYSTGRHSFKVGFDFRKVEVESFFFPTIRGLLRYPTLQRYIDDAAEAGNINKALPGGEEIQFYNWWDYFAFVQDEWRVRDNLTLNLGLRYETPGNSMESLYPVNDQIIAAAGGDQDYALFPRPRRDTNNFQPRVGFNWNPRTSAGGLFGLLTGGDKLVVRGGYARTHDYQFININLNVASAFPFVAAVNLASIPNGLNGAYSRLQSVEVTGLNPRTLTRTIVAEDLRSPSADQVSLEVQRQLGQDFAFKIGYVGTRGNDLFQTVDGNPRMPFSTQRVDTTRGVIRERCNCAESTYHSLQTSLEKRFSKGLSFGVHYTWSAYTDTASEIFNPSSGEVAVAQDSFDLGADRARSTYDRPHRVSGNVVYELPMYRDQQGFLGKLLGGWQANAFFTVQSGAPFTVLNGADPTGALSGIDGLVGNAIRPNLNTNLDLAGMTIQEILDAGGRSLFRPLCGNPSATCPGERVGNVGRNSLRADGLANLDLGFIKTTRLAGEHRLQLWIQLFNALNHRNFGIPDGRINSANFLNEKGTNGGNRRIVVAARYLF